MKKAQKPDENISYALETLPCGIVIAELDEKFTITRANGGYYNLMGYTEEEYKDKFSNGLFDAKYPTYNTEETLEMLRDQITIGENFSLKIKLSHKWKGYIWAHFSGKVCETKDGTSKIYFAVVDVSEHLLMLELLEKDHEYIQYILALSDDSFFDYDVPGDVLRLSANFAKALGISETIRGYPETLINSGVIADDSKYLFVKSFQPGEHALEEVHFKMPNGEDAWYSIHYNANCDEEGKPVRVVGKIVDITGRVERIIELREKATRDPLTKLLNKEETRVRITETLNDRRKGNEKCVFMMIDIDKFKDINDTFGHQFGDKVLVEVAQKLKRIFRDNDIVGRIGGDEFIVLMKDVSVMEIVEAKAMAITEAFRQEISLNSNKYKISGSVGIAVYPDNGKTFEELYFLADIALYASKNKGRDCYTIYKEG